MFLQLMSSDVLNGQKQLMDYTFIFKSDHVLTYNLHYPLKFGFCFVFCCLFWCVCVFTYVKLI